jgi:hypothetical protein
MGLLASIFAYLGAVAAIIAFFLMSADALLHHHPHHRPTNPRSELITAAEIGPHEPSEAASPLQHSAETGAIPQRRAAVEYRRQADLSKARSDEHHRRALRQEQQRRDGAQRPERVAAPLALGARIGLCGRACAAVWRVFE